MKITYYGHSCFIIESGGYSAAIDPYDPHVEGYPPLRISAHSVYCSHQHFDHCYVDAVDILQGGPADPFTAEAFEVPHDDAGGEKRGMNLIRVFRAEGKKIIHFGDTGCMPDTAVLEQLKDADAIMIPVGGFFTIGPRQARELADVISPKLVIPMHYKNGKVGLQQIEELSVFLEVCKGAAYPVRAMEYGETIVI